MTKYYLTPDRLKCVGGPCDGQLIAVPRERRSNEPVQVPRHQPLPAMSYSYSDLPQPDIQVNWYLYLIDEICMSESSGLNPGQHVRFPIVRFLRYAEIDSAEAIRHQFRK